MCKGNVVSKSLLHSGEFSLLCIFCLGLTKCGHRGGETITTAEFINCCVFIIAPTTCSGPGGLTFSWWGCSGLCPTHKPAELAYSFYSVLCVCFCLYGSIKRLSFHKFSRQLPAFSLCSSCLFLSYWSFWLYIPL